MIVPHGVDGRHITAGRGVVYHVVVYQGSIVEQLYGHGGGKYLVVDGTEHSGAYHHHQWAYLFSLGAQQRHHYAAHECVGVLQLVGYPLVEPL